MNHALSIILIIFTSFLHKPSHPTPVNPLHSVTKTQIYKDQDCLRRCGNIDIPYPFGIGPSHCYFNDSFAVTCDSSSSSSSLPTLRKYNLELLRIQVFGSLWVGQISVNFPPVTACVDNKNQRNGTSFTTATVSVPKGSPFEFANYGFDGNVFASVGCEGYAMLYNATGAFVTGCTSVCGNENLLSAVVRERGCYGYNCCHSIIEYTDISSEGIKEYTISVSIMNSSTSNSASLSCRSAFLIQQDHLEAMSQLAPDMSSVPVALRWTVTHKEKGDSILSEVGGIILMLALPGVLIASLLIVGYGVWRRIKTRAARNEIKLRKKYFEERVEEQGSFSREDTDKVKLFTLTELKKATNNFSHDLIVGRGGQGTVYKGMLKNGQVIAVKKSGPLEEIEWKAFVNEVILLSQIKHRHIVKMFGCCLDADVPLIVYEFIPNGTLSGHIRGSSGGDSLLTSKMRLRIAFETASAIAYLHSESQVPIYHRDIKSSNILLDEKYRAKLADFGISRAISVEQTHLTTSVQGTFGYLDPEYFHSSQYSEKSDVYSFGVVLVELLTSQKPIRSSTILEEYDEAVGEEISLVMYFISSMNDSTLFNIIDPVVSQGCSREDIMVVANVAKQCLEPRGLERPTMKEIAGVLEGLRRHNLSSKMSDQFIDWDTGEHFIPTPLEIGDASSHVAYDDITIDKIFYTANESIRLLQTL